ncbi:MULTISPECIES: DUF1418 family protein [Pantoea]|uniref:DUF1418 family protein n=1 Tax=Candidatus Pantoea multigeneris TaxID=2608357 RepID=A0ABX0RHJ4_9GAMM|nr:MULTISPECIES: DUF1418 family protein [Pantoea]NIF22874.1 DUF1418 family protein [Pantoea multigeneris]
MRNIMRLPKKVLLLEAVGGLLLIIALLVVNQWLPTPAMFERKTLAIILSVVGIALMLPSCWLIAWRTAQAMAPQLFDQPRDKK